MYGRNTSGFNHAFTSILPKQISKTNTHLSEARIRTILYSQTLDNSYECERAGSRLVTALIVACTRTQKQTDEERGNGLVVDVVNTSLRPLVVHDAFQKISDIWQGESATAYP
jgi:hypothetical protein